MAGAMVIPAFLRGVANLTKNLTTTQGASVGVRPGGDGRPLGAYRGGGWFYGVYFNGFSGAWGGSAESWSVNLAVGIDVTRIITEQPTKDQGEWFLREGELYERVAWLSELLLGGGSEVANACNEAFAEMMDGKPNGLFRERFDTVRVGTARNESPGWIVAKGMDDKPIFVMGLALSGLKFHKLFSEAAKGI